VKEGDVLVGLASPGLRSNGYTLVRRVIGEDTDFDASAWEGADRTLGEELLLPSVIYAPTIAALTSEFRGAIHAVAHITGGGIMGNVVRILPDALDAVIDMESFETPEIFFEIQRRGRISADEMVQVFNCGLGMVLALDPSAAEGTISSARAHGVGATVVGSIRLGGGKVVLE
jgi:phosphoribosylformylglycinamidine cyclo-ligase